MLSKRRSILLFDSNVGGLGEKICGLVNLGDLNKLVLCFPISGLLNGLRLVDLECREL